MAQQFKQIMLIISKMDRECKFLIKKRVYPSVGWSPINFFFGLLETTCAVYTALFKRNWASYQLLEAQNPTNSGLDILMVRWSFVGLEAECHIN